MKTSIKTHITLTRPEIELILKALVRKRTGMPVSLCYTELEQLKNVIELKAYHFECNHGETTEETPKKKDKEKREMHAMHAAQMDGEQPGPIQAKRRRN